MLGTSHQLCKSELWPDPETEDEAVEDAYFLEPLMAAFVNWLKIGDFDGDQQKQSSLDYCSFKLLSAPLSAAIAYGREHPQI